MPNKRPSKTKLLEKALKEYEAKYRSQIEFSETLWNDPECLEPQPDPLTNPDLVIRVEGQEPPALFGAPEAFGFTDPDDNPRKLSLTERDVHLLLDHLRRAAELPTPIVFAHYLSQFLLNLGVRIPKGVNLNFSAPNPGRPPEEDEAMRSFTAYCMFGGYGKAAKELNPEEYKRNPKAASDHIRFGVAFIQKRYPSEPES